MDTPTPDPDDTLARSEALHERVRAEEPERRREHEQQMARLDALNAKLERDLAEQRAQEPERRREHEAAMAELEATRARLEALKAQPSGPAQGGGTGSLKTTVTQVRKWAEEEEHPNWIWAAYADLAQRLARVEGQLEEIADSLRMVIGQLAMLDKQERPDED
jgi:hypothetical protein